MDLSVIIVSYNVCDYLRNCINSVKKALEGIDSEIIVTDNNSQDGSADMIISMFPAVMLIRNKSNRGFAAACNQAIKEASAKYLLLLNPDTIVEEDCFKKCINFMNNHPEAGAMGVRMTDGNGKFLRESKRSLPDPMTAFYRISGLSKLFPSSPLFSNYYLPGIGSNETAPVQVLTGAFMFIRKEALEKAGFIDEDYFMYGEDIELSYKLQRAGYLLWYYPVTSIIHYKGRSSGRNCKTIFHFYGAMRIYMRKRQAERPSFLYYLVIPAIYLRQSLALPECWLKFLFHR